MSSWRPASNRPPSSAIFPSDGTVEAEKFTVLKEDGHLVLVSELSGHPAELRAWVSQLAESDEVESVAQH